MKPPRVKERDISVLYVDDEPAFLDVMKFALERSGNFSITTVLDAPGALQLLNENTFDAIVSDYQMPVMDGIAFLKAVRQQFGGIPFILFTGRGREEVVIEAINNGADFYLQKGGDMKAQIAELTNMIHYAVTHWRMERNLRESEERYRHVVEDQTELICRFLPDGAHIFVNEAYCRYFGIRREDIIGSRFKPNIPPGDREKVAQMISSLTPEHPLGSIEQRIIMPDGSIRWQRWNDRAIYHGDGSLKEYQSVGRDITEIKRIEEALRESEEKYRTVFENTGTATVVIEEDRTISLANTEFERLSGYSKKEIEGKKCWTEFVLKEDLGRMLSQHEIRRQNHTKALTHYEFRFVTKSGDLRDIYLSIDMIPGTKKSIASLQDITTWKQSQVALKENEERFRQLFSRMPSGVAIYRAVDDGRDFVFTDFNPSAEAIEHIKKEEVIGKRVTEVFPGVFEFGIFSVFQRVWKTGTPEFLPASIYRNSHSPGTWRENWVFRLPSGEIVAIYNDITDRKKAEETLKERERVLSTLISNLPGFVYRCRNDPDWTMEYMSDGCLDITGYSPRDFIGNATLAYNDIVHPDYREPLWRLWQELLEKHEIFEQEYPIITRNGDIRWVWERGRGVFSEGGQLLFLEGFITDITQRRQAEETLKKSKEQLGLAIEGSGVGLWDWKVQTGETQFNERWAQIIGYTLDELSPISIETWIMHTHPDDLAQSNLQLQRHFSHEIPVYECEVRMKHKDGHWVWILDRGKVTEWGPDGKPVRMTGTHLDISTRKHAEEALRKANRQMRILTGITRHDLLNSIMVVEGYLNLLDDPGAPPFHSTKESIRQAIQRMKRQIQFTKDYEALGSQEPVWQNLEMLFSRLEVPPSVRLELPRMGTEVYADPMLGKVLENLLDNSLRHGGDHLTEIRVTGLASDAGFTLTWEDNGVGVPFREKERIFERGFGKGTGLGLFFAREILETTGITIHEAGNPGEGARFLITIPPGHWRPMPHVP
ncbi:MAG: Bacterioopsin transcriptional activator [Methanoregulaceae archaeon PtaU1.Bin059]|nr:MAG: Bacterioopsin transcriptional activator [Methanoregulaceae archaeon PtaU1.Bin059]